VSDLLAVWTWNSIAYRLRASRVSKNAFARGCWFSAAWRSLGTSIVLGESYATAQRPSCFARSIAAKPAGFIRPESINAAAFSRLRLDQILRLVRGVNFCRLWFSSSPFA